MSSMARALAGLKRTALEQTCSGVAFSTKRADGRPRTVRLELGHEPIEQMPAAEAPKGDRH
jgi:hypothetical protein